MVYITHYDHIHIFLTEKIKFLDYRTNLNKNNIISSEQIIYTYTYNLQYNQKIDNIKWYLQHFILFYLNLNIDISTEYCCVPDTSELAFFLTLTNWSLKIFSTHLVATLYFEFYFLKNNTLPTCFDKINIEWYYYYLNLIKFLIKLLST